MIYDSVFQLPPPSDRPSISLVMVCTIDGKIVTGNRSEAVMDLGSSLDHETMRYLESQADAVMIGAGTLRATKRITYSSHLVRIVVAANSMLDAESPFFTEAPGRGFVLTSQRSAEKFEAIGLSVLACGEDEIDFVGALNQLRCDMKISKLLLEGGSELNASLLRLNFVDEIFLTIAPKIKLGKSVPTIAGGVELPRGELLKFELMTCKAVGDEVFLRYRRANVVE